MIATKDIYWLAGLLEGEGAFCVRGSLSVNGTRGVCPVIQLGSTDKDVIERAANLMGHTKPPGVEGLGTSARRTKPLYKIVVSGYRGVGWMMTLYPLLGERRRARIKEILLAWRARPTRGHRAAHVEPFKITLPSGPLVLHF